MSVTTAADRTDALDDGLKLVGLSASDPGLWICLLIRDYRDNACMLNAPL